MVEMETGIKVPHSHRFYPYWMMYDIESLLLAKDLPPATNTTTFHSQHQLVSVSICSNIPQFDNPVCFVRQTTVDECVERFVRYAERASMKADELLQPKYKHLCTKIKAFLSHRTDAERKFENAQFSNDRTYRSRANLCGLMDKIGAWIRQVPMVSFNGQNYDLHTMKGAVLREG